MEKIRSHYSATEVKLGTYVCQLKLIYVAIIKDPKILGLRQGLLFASVYTSLAPEFLGDSRSPIYP